MQVFFLNAITVRPRKKKKKETHKSSKFSENWNDLSEKKFTLLQNSVYSSFFWHQLQDVLAMHDHARTISNDVRIDLRRIGI